MYGGIAKCKSRTFKGKGVRLIYPQFQGHQKRGLKGSYKDLSVT